MEDYRRLDVVQFNCLYQGNPASTEGKLYRPFNTWTDKKEYGRFIHSGAYTDVSDEGNDFLSTFTYDIYLSPTRAFNINTKRYDPVMYILITDMDYTDANTDVTIVTQPEIINRASTQRWWIESNNGGSVYAKAVRKKVRAQVVPFTQTYNKESRIITNAAMVNTVILFPFGWEMRYKAVHDHLAAFLRDFKANAHDDIEDALTGVYEKEVLNGDTRAYSQMSEGIRRIN